MSDPKKGTNTMHLEGEDAVKQLKELIGHNGICLFTTNLTSVPLQTRPMSTQSVDNEGNLWFLSSKSSHKNFEIGDDARVQLFYASRGNSEYLSVYGRAEVLRDHDKIEEIWSPVAKAWFQQGKDDPDLSVIKVVPEDIYYWDTKNGRMVSLMKIMASVVVGRTMDDSVEGKLKV
jgi:general stress protein 26